MRGPEIAQPKINRNNQINIIMAMKLTAVMSIMAACTVAPTFGSTVVLDSTDASSGPPLNGSAPINTTSTQAAVGTGSWQANGSSPSQYYLYANANSATERGLGQLTISSLNSLSFETYLTPAQAAAAPNWYLIIYTAPHANGEASWYGNRLILEPYLSQNLNNQGNQWVTWATGAGANQLTVNDSALSGNLGSYTQPTLAAIQSGAINWNSYTGGSSTPVNYADMNIEGIVLSTGNPWANGFNGLVDNVNINSTQGNVQFDLESTPVPEPTTMVAGMLLLLPFGASMLRMLRKAQQFDLISGANRF
ncbi:MAG: hypothetical protein P4L87_15675 [Formivibrio sp.]|nr:hypothetical protein [Formivibrio sp.]